MELEKVLQLILAKNEVNEFYAKTRFWRCYMQLFETMKIDNGHIPRLTYHTNRIKCSSSD